MLRNQGNVGKDRDRRRRCGDNIRENGRKSEKGIKRHERREEEREEKGKRIVEQGM